ncbi:MAG: type IV pilus assembly protein PilM, partial [Gaiellaceae bacterium]
FEKRLLLARPHRRRPEPVEPWDAEPELPPEPDDAAAEPAAARPETGAEAPAGLEATRARRPLPLPRLSLPSRAHGVTQTVGLKIGASQIAAAQIANNGAAELLQIAREPLGQGVVVGGELRDPDALVAALDKLFSEHRLPRRNVRLGIASNRIGVRSFELVDIGDERQLRNAIHFRAQEALPIPLDEAVLDYRVLSEGVDDAGAVTKKVLLVVAYRELVERYVAACRAVGIAVAGVDLEAFALLRALAAPLSENETRDSALVAVAIGHDRSTFAVSDGNVCMFTRVLEWGGASLNVALARALDLAPSEVETTKRLLSLAAGDAPAAIELSPERYRLAVDAVRRQVQSFARELVSSLQFYQHQPDSLGIGEIVITGGTAGLDGLAAELERLVGVRVRVGDPLARLKVGKKVDVGADVGSMAVAIGLGIDD